MSVAADESLYDGLQFAKNLGKRGKHLADIVRKLIDLRSRLSDFNNALTAIHSATRFLQEAEAQSGPDNHDEYARSILRALNAQAVVLYCRGSEPKGERIPLPLHKWLLTPEEEAKHRNIINVRNKVIAHHVESKADIGGPWLTERMYFTYDDRHVGVGVQLLRFDFKSETTWDILEMARKAVERLQPLDDELVPQIALELDELVHDPENAPLLERSKFALQEGAKASDMAESRTTYSFKTYPEKGSPFQKR